MQIGESKSIELNDVWLGTIKRSSEKEYFYNCRLDKHNQWIGPFRYSNQAEASFMERLKGEYKTLERVFGEKK